MYENYIKCNSYGTFTDIHLPTYNIIPLNTQKNLIIILFCLLLCLIILVSIYFIFYDILFFKLTNNTKIFNFTLE